MARRRRPNPPAPAVSSPAPAVVRTARRGPAGPTLLLAVLAVAAVSGGWWWSRRPPADAADARARIAARQPAPGGLNVVVVTLDTLRADRLGCYGSRAVATPNLDALCASGVVFENATAVVPLTFPSHASMFTGKLPPQHGVRDNGGFFLEDSETTLAERLRGAGWATGAFVGAWVLESKWGLAQGFDHYSDRFDLSKFKVVSLGTVQKRGDEVMTDALGWLEQKKDDRFFAWIHLYDPHTPYSAPEEFAARYPGEPYNAEVAWTDAVVGRLLDWLRDRGLEDRTLVVLTSDHGESLGEHGEATHAFFVYQATTHVPLVVRTPWGDRGRTEVRASGADLMNTVLDLVGQPVDATVEGRSLARFVLAPDTSEERAVYSETFFPRFHFGWQHLRALRRGNYTYVDAPEPELYDLAADPGETRNVYKAFSRRAEDLRLELERLGAERAASAPERKKLDPETLQRLAALGYVGNAADVDPAAVLPDPKSKIRLFGQMNAAKDLAQAGRTEEAIRVQQALLAEDPQIVDAWVTLGNWLGQARRPDEAIEAYRRALALQPEHQNALLNLAHVYRARGEMAAALEGYRSALKIDPQSPQAWYQLATLHLDAGHVAEAEKTFREALTHNPRMGAAYNSLGVIAHARGDVRTAEQFVRKGLELEPEVRTGRFNLARLLEARGELAEAERLYREELATYPDNGKARFNLAQMRRQQGDRAGWVAELRRATETAPDFAPAWLFLAREELGAGRLDAAERLARQGLEAGPRDPVAPLGHYVLADVASRQGRRDVAQREAERARSLESALRRDPRPAL